MEDRLRRCQSYQKRIFKRFI